MQFGQLECCGVKEIRYLSHSDDAHAAMRCFALGCLGGKKKGTDLLEVPNVKISYEGNISSIIGVRFRYAIFTEAAVDRASYGKLFAKFILDNKLGEVIKTGVNINPNSTNSLQAYIWTVDHDALRGWWEKENGTSQSSTQGTTL